jgi:RNA polymerase primary sigma factor
MNKQAHISPIDQVRRQNRLNLRAGGQRRRPGLNPGDQRVLRRLLSKLMDYIDSPSFRERNAERKIYDDAPPIPKPDTAWYQPLMDDPRAARAMRDNQQRDSVLLTAAQEQVLFHQFNYARYRIRQIQETLGITADNGAKREPSPEQADEMLRWHRIADQVREQIAETNLALVLAMAKRTRMSEVDFADLISEGNMALLRSVDKFDADRGFKFSTYACRAILKAFSRQGMKLSKYRQRFPTDFDPALEKSDALETRRRDLEEDASSHVADLVRQNNCGMSEIERLVIEHRFGLDTTPDHPPMTLEQVGQIIGVTKERVRQIQNKALEKIRVDLEENFLNRFTPKRDEATGRLLIEAN